ncbi:hypothetical protein AG1IA_07734 [Rhizoctonia solani AG-1 IA]|uniref:Uncharacterized protein n=1 Tax=Thanatephorus cucumeris (strain AG1-IA) TaxID=983506 RepID=L8WK03_THACA|nr:hypothetical protein AG1IA_07734 [Rhizoctonia solani AG-1 IA]
MSKKPPKALSSRRQVMFEPVYPVPQFRSPDVHPLTLRRPGYHSLPEPFPREHTDSRPCACSSRAPWPCHFIYNHTRAHTSPHTLHALLCARSLVSLCSSTPTASALSVYEGRRSHAAETLQSSPDSDRDHASCVLRAPEISTLNFNPTIAALPLWNNIVLSARVSADVSSAAKPPSPLGIDTSVPLASRDTPPWKYGKSSPCFRGGMSNTPSSPDAVLYPWLYSLNPGRTSPNDLAIVPKSTHPCTSPGFSPYAVEQMSRAEPARRIAVLRIVLVQIESGLYAGPDECVVKSRYNLKFIGQIHPSPPPPLK